MNTILLRIKHNNKQNVISIWFRWIQSNTKLSQSIIVIQAHRILSNYTVTKEGNQDNDKKNPHIKDNNNTVIAPFRHRVSYDSGAFSVLPFLLSYRSDHQNMRFNHISDSIYSNITRGLDRYSSVMFMCNTHLLLSKGEPLRFYGNL